MEFNYYYGDEAEQFTFIRIPKVMLTDDKFSSLSLAAKILYGLLLDRMSLSMKNGWLDEEKRVFIIFKIEEMMELLGFSKKKAIDCLAELEKFGLVEKKRRGLGLPSILYIKSFMGTSRSVEIDTSVKEEEYENSLSKDFKNENSIQNMSDNHKNIQENTDIKPLSTVFPVISCVRGVDFDTSGGVENELQEVSISEPLEVQKSTPLKNNTDINNTYVSDNKSYLITHVGAKMRSDEIAYYTEVIKENIDYENLLISYPTDKEMLEGILDLIVETVSSKSETMTIASSMYHAEFVRAKFLKLNYCHIEYVLNCLNANTTKVRNIKKYLLATLFNAPSTINAFYRAEVNSSFPQYVCTR